MHLNGHSLPSANICTGTVQMKYGNVVVAGINKAKSLFYSIVQVTCNGNKVP